MVKQCVWCCKHFAIPKRGKHLCSICEEAYQTGKYCIDKNLREMPHRHKKNFREYLEQRDMSVGDLQMKANIIVKEMMTSDIIRELYPYFKKMRSNFTPYKLWQFLTTYNIWLDVETAKELMKLYPNWRYIHAIGPRVLDTWNFKGAGIAECYYKSNVSFHTILGRQYPSGELTRKSDVVELGSYTSYNASKLFSNVLVMAV